MMQHTIRSRMAASVQRVRIVALCALSAGFLGSCSLNGVTDNYGYIGQHIPRNAVYVLTITGSAEIDEEPTGVTWSEQASMSVQPSFGTGVAQNGRNLVEIGLFTHESPFEVDEPGLVYVGTHTAMRVLGGGFEEGPTYDVVYMDINSSAGQVEAIFDSGILAGTGLPEREINRFKMGTGDTAQVLVTLAGSWTFTFSNEGQNVSGTITLRGAREQDFPLDARYYYKATFVGTRVN